MRPGQLVPDRVGPYQQRIADGHAVNCMGMHAVADRQATNKRGYAKSRSSNKISANSMAMPL